MPGQYQDCSDQGLLRSRHLGRAAPQSSAARNGSPSGAQAAGGHWGENEGGFRTAAEDGLLPHPKLFLQKVFLDGHQRYFNFLESTAPEGCLNANPHSRDTQSDGELLW